MELHLDPVIPMLRKGHDGRFRFNKGYHSPYKGKTYPEIYGKDRASEILTKKRKKLIGHKNYNIKGVYHSKPCVAINEGKLIARFESCIQAAQALGTNKNSVYRWINGISRPRNGWKWFYENESWKWCDLIIG